MQQTRDAASLVPAEFHYALIDFALMCWVTFGMWRLYETDDFTNIRKSLVWGIVSGVGLLIKQPYPFFFVLPCLWMIGRRRPDGAVRSTRLKSFLCAVGLTLLVAVPWYWWEGIFAIQNSLGQAFERGVAQHNPDFLSLQGWIWYLRAMLDQMGFAAFLVTILGLVLMPLRKIDKRGMVFLSLWAFSGYIGLTLLHNKDTRYDLPIVPAVAMLAALGWTSVFEMELWRPWLTAGILGLFLWNAKHIDPPHREDWKHDPIGAVLEEHHDIAQPFLISSVQANFPYFFGRSLRWSLRKKGIQLYTEAPGDPLADFVEFVIVKSGDLGPDAERVSREWRILKSSGRRFSSLYPVIAHFPLPDGSEAAIYQRDWKYAFQINHLTKQTMEKHLAASLSTLIDGPLKVSIKGTAAQLQKGRVTSAEILGGPWVIRNLPIANADIRIQGAWLNLYTLWDEHKPGLLAFTALEPKIEIDAQDVQKMLTQRTRALDDLRVRFENGEITISGGWKHLKLGASAKVYVTPEVLVATINRIKVAWLPVPAWILGRAQKYEIPLYPTPSFPGRILIHRIVVGSDTLKIS